MCVRVSTVFQYSCVFVYDVYRLIRGYLILSESEKVPIYHFSQNFLSKIPFIWSTMFHRGDAVAVERAGIWVYAVEPAGICIGEILVGMAERNLLRSKCVCLRSCTHIMNGTSPCPLGATFKNEWKVGIPSKSIESTPGQSQNASRTHAGS